MPVEVGQIVEGKITGITRFGAFVEISEGVTGLVHISEVADSFVRDVNDFLKEDEIVKVRLYPLLRMARSAFPFVRRKRLPRIESLKKMI